MNRLPLVEPTPERRRALAESGTTPSALLTRWAWLAYAVVKFAIGGTLAGLLNIFLAGALIEFGLVSGEVGAVLGILGFIPMGHLFYAWGFPVRY